MVQNFSHFFSFCWKVKADSDQLRSSIPLPLHEDDPKHSNRIKLQQVTLETQNHSLQQGTRDTKDCQVMIRLQSYNQVQKVKEAPE